jgi:VWFA-related protein
MKRRLSALGLAIAITAGLHAQQPPGPNGSPPARTVFVTVTDRHGVPVEDLTAADFELKEGGKIVQVVDAAVAEQPLQIALIVDDNGTGLFRAALARFVQQMEGRAVMAVSTVVGQTMKLVDYTPKAEALLRGIATLNARPGSPDGGQLLEGIYEAALELRRREALRPVIIALTVGGEEHSTVTSDHVLDNLRDSRAALHVVSVEGAALRSTVAAQRPRDLMQENLHLQRVLGDGSKQTGGRYQSIVASPGYLSALQQLASELTSQYQVTYTLPPGVKASDRLHVAVKRKGLTVRAPNRIKT